MRFRRLDLLAYGGFDAVEIPFDRAAAGDLQVVFGRNEAGKSTCLRGIFGFLFGIPRNTTDAHRHVAKDLRIGAELEFDDGSVRGWIRRKGQKNTLLEPSGSAASETEWSERLAGMDRQRFERVFGLDHNTLRLGAEALLEGEGEVTEGLFDAGFGSRVAVHRVLRALDEEAEAIYKRRGKNTPLNRAISAFKTANKLVSATARTHTAWQQQIDGIEQERRQLEQLRAMLRDCVARTDHLAVEERMAPRLARLAELDAALADGGDLADLPPDASERRGRALAARDAAQQGLARADAELRSLADRAAEASAPQDSAGLEALLDGDVPILRERAASHRRARQGESIDRLAAEAAASEAGVREAVHRLAARLAPDQLELLVAAENPEVIEHLLASRPNAAAIQRLRTAAAAFEEAHSAAELVTARARRLDQRRKEAPVAEPGVVDALRRGCEQLEDAIRRASEVRGVAEALAEDEAEVERLAQAAARALAAVPGEWESTSELEAVRLPSEAELDALRARTKACAEQGAALDVRREELARAEQALGREELGHAALGELPSEAGLTAQRARRDELWRSIRHRLGGPVPEADVTAFEGELVGADATVDQLRSAADQVARARMLAGQRARLESDLTAVVRDAEEWSGQRDTVLGEWRAILTRCRSGDPDTKLAGGAEALSTRVDHWIELRRAAVGAAHDEATAQSTLDVARQRVSVADERVRRALGSLSGGNQSADCVPSGARFGELLDVAERELASARERRDGLREREQETANQEREWQEQQLAVAEHAERRQRTEREWLAACNGFAEVVPGLARLDRGAVLVVVEELQSLWELADRAAALRERERAAVLEQEAFREFASKVLARAVELGLIEGVAPVDESAECMPRVDALLVAADAERKRLDLRIEWAAQRERFERQRTVAQAEIAQAHEQLSELCRAAGVEAAEQLPEALQRAEDRRAQAAERRLLWEEIRADLGERTADEWRAWLADGGSLRDDSDPQAAEVGFDPALAKAMRHDLDQRVADLDAEIRAAQRELWSKESGLEELRDNRIEDHVLRREEARAAAEDGIERYVRLCAAADLLREEMARYREANQDPLLGRAGELFARLTNGRYRGLDVGIGSKDQPVLLCVRRDGKTIGREGLSDGTADPLYLALRMATIEQRLDVAESMPLVLDDVLVHFDDERASAALDVLAELGGRCQVLLFTHHRRDVELARGMRDRVRVHDLDVLGRRGDLDAAGLAAE